MGQFFQDGGWVMVPILCMGFVFTGVAALQGLRPLPNRWRVLHWLAVALLALGVYGFTHAVVTTLRAAQQFEGAEKTMVLVGGLAESANNLELMLLFLVFGGVVSAVGAGRERPA